MSNINQRSQHLKPFDQSIVGLKQLIDGMFHESAGPHMSHSQDTHYEVPSDEPLGKNPDHGYGLEMERFTWFTI